MRYVAAYLLATLGGNATPSEADVKKILSSVGIEADQAKLTKVLGELKGKDLAALIAEGEKKLASVPAAGAAPAAAAPAAAAAAPAAKAEKKEEKKKEEKPPSDDDMGFGLFD
eukprot:m.219768 g.219768  ORF g.219768 m.219768 type:complete len:113 (+) comp10243_c0_seq1:175-513(+)